MSVTVSPARADELDALLPLIAAYQRFYGVERPDDARNRAFFARFLAPSDEGLLLAAWRTGQPMGFATVYWTHSSIGAEDVAHMNDLFTVAAARGRGVGRALIEAAKAAARERGVDRLTWMTAPDNAIAQGLYDRTGAVRSVWLEYELRL